MIFPWSRKTSHDDPVVQRFVRQHVPSPKNFVSLIDEDDEMFLFDFGRDQGGRRRTAINYFAVGSRIFGAIQQIADWHFHGLSNVSSFLDFACGYGRSTRFLSRELPPGRIWACDIYPKAVAFQKRHYGVNGIVSVPAPADFPRDRKFDFIFASSFFTHMPESTFAPWMDTLHGLLTDRGILVFSTHDTSLIPPLVPVPPEGILFVASSESRTLDTQQYGSTYAGEHFVSRVVDQVTAGKSRLYRISRGLDCFQDIYIVAKGLNREFTELNFLHDPRGCCDAGEISPDGHACLTGWAADINPGASIQAVQFLSNGRLIAAVTPSHDLPEVAAFFQRPSVLRSGWICNLPRKRVRSGDLIEIKVVNNRNQSRVIAYDFLNAMVCRVRAAG